MGKQEVLSGKALSDYEEGRKLVGNIVRSGKTVDPQLFQAAMYAISSYLRLREIEAGIQKIVVRE